MKPQDKEDKDQIKLRYAAGLHKALKERSIKSYRKLATAAGMEPAHVHRIVRGRIDVALTTNIAISKALGLTYAQLAAYYDSVTQKDIDEYVEAEKQRNAKVKKQQKPNKTDWLTTSWCLAP